MGFFWMTTAASVQNSGRPGAAGLVGKRHASERPGRAAKRYGGAVVFLQKAQEVVAELAGVGMGQRVCAFNIPRADRV